MSMPPTDTAATSPPGPAIELRLALRLLPASDGLGCGWQFSAQAGDAPPLHFSSLAELVHHLVRLTQGVAPPRGIR